MANQSQRDKHADRIRQKENHINKQMKIRKAHSFPNDEPHKYHKMSGTSCGDPNCHMCGNPRKFFKELTMQEKRFMQKELYDDGTTTDGDDSCA